MRWGGRQQFRRGVAEAALIEDQEVKPGEMRCEGELLAQRSLRQAQCYGDGGRVDFKPQQARSERDAAPIALLINELVTNALRHAFPDERRGQVAIAVGAQGRIVVADNGIGLSAAAPSREAFGRSLAEMLARQIGAELVFEDAAPGTRAVVMLPGRSERAS